MQNKMFDLNIEKILEDWEIYHAIREIIANALDEQSITKTRDIEIFKESNKWHIRDFGRGIKYDHLTQKENEEKIKNPNLIGKFGIGLKDALATFDRKSVKVLIKSKYGDITLGKSQKHDFDDITTLHAYISPPAELEMIGTDFILEGIIEQDITEAKRLFLIFNNEAIIERTQYGEVLKKSQGVANIYLNGVKVAEEENFLFSYNITSLDHKIRKALNRERTNVGRSAYSDRIKLILKSTKNQAVAKFLADDLKNYSSGPIHDELGWIDVQEHAVKILNSLNKVVFLTPEEMMCSPDIVDHAKTEGFEIITIPNNLKDKVTGQEDISGNPVVDFGRFYRQYEENFEFEFIEPKDLTKEELKIFKLTNEILNLIGGRPRNVKEIRISNTMRNELGLSETTGLWEPIHGRIIIRRSQLSSLEAYSGTLVHEAIHALTGYSDVSRNFENELTDAIGRLCSKFFSRNFENGLTNAIGTLRSKFFS